MHNMFATTVNTSPECLMAGKLGTQLTHSKCT